MKRMILLVSILLVAGLLMPAACSSAPKATVPAAQPYPVPAPAPRIGVAPAPDIGASIPGAVSSTAQDRLIVRNGDLSLVVKDVVQTRDDIAQLATRLEGYVVSTSISGKDLNLKGNIVIRVPDTRFESAIGELRKLAVRVNTERTSSQDVTEEYSDLQARLKNAQATENQLLVLLQKADKVDDILKVYQQLTQVRQQIEQLKGRIQYLERSSSMSLISVNLEPESSATPVVSPGWSFWEIIKAAARGFVTFGQVLITVLVWLLFFVPIWGTVVAIIYWRRRKKRAAS